LAEARGEPVHLTIEEYLVSRAIADPDELTDTELIMFAHYVAQRVYAVVTKSDQDEASKAWFREIGKSHYADQINDATNAIRSDREMLAKMMRVAQAGENAFVYDRHYTGVKLDRKAYQIYSTFVLLRDFFTKRQLPTQRGLNLRLQPQEVEEVVAIFTRAGLPPTASQRQVIEDHDFTGDAVGDAKKVVRHTIHPDPFGDKCEPGRILLSETKLNYIIELGEKHNLDAISPRGALDWELREGIGFGTAGLRWALKCVVGLDDDLAEKLVRTADEYYRKRDSISRFRTPHRRSLRAP
jgi:hypothetical protein